MAFSRFRAYLVFNTTGPISRFGLLLRLLLNPEDPWVAYSGHDDRLRRLPACSWISIRVVYVARRVPIFMKSDHLWWLLPQQR